MRLNIAAAILILMSFHLCIEAKSTNPAKTKSSSLTAAKIRPIITANYYQIALGYKSGNLDKILSYFSEDFSNINDGSVTDKNAFSDSTEALLKRFEFNSSSIKIIKFSMKGSAAVAVTSQRLFAYFNDDKGKLHEFELTESDQDTWIKTKKGWKMLSSKTLKSKQKVDGEEMVSPEPGSTMDNGDGG